MFFNISKSEIEHPKSEIKNELLHYPTPINTKALCKVLLGAGA
jgi:hypothetical protein